MASVSGTSAGMFLPYLNIVQGEEIHSAHYTKNTLIRDSIVDRISSAANLVLDNCTITGEVSAKNLFLNDTTATIQNDNSENVARATQNIWTKMTPVSDGSVRVPACSAEGDIILSCITQGVKSVYFIPSQGVVSGQNFIIEPPLESVFLENVQLRGNIIFNGNSSAKNTATLKGNSYLEGKVIGGTLIDRSIVPGAPGA